MDFKVLSCLWNCLVKLHSMNLSFANSFVRQNFQSLHIRCLGTLISINKMLHVYHPCTSNQQMVNWVVWFCFWVNFPSMDRSGVTWMSTMILESRKTASIGYDSSACSSSVLHQSKKIVCRMCFVFVFTSAPEREHCSGPYEAFCPLSSLLGPNTHILRVLLLHREIPVWYSHHPFIL